MPQEFLVSIFWKEMTEGDMSDILKVHPRKPTQFLKNICWKGTQKPSESGLVESSRSIELSEAFVVKFPFIAEYCRTALIASTVHLSWKKRPRQPASFDCKDSHMCTFEDEVWLAGGWMQYTWMLLRLYVSTSQGSNSGIKYWCKKQYLSVSIIIQILFSEKS